MFNKVPLSTILLLVSIAGYAWPQPGTAQPGGANGVKIRNSREYKGLCKRAKSADDFKALSAWCSGRSTMCKRKVAELEAELSDYYSKPSVAGPKYPPRDQTLRGLIAHYRSLAGQWQASADRYTARLASLDATSTNQQK